MDAPTALAIPPTMQPVQAQLEVRRDAARRYVAVFMVALALFVISSFLVPLFPWFTLHNTYAGAPYIGYGERIAHSDCEVLIYGDSTALTGLDPVIIQQMTGLKTCNISEAAPVGFFVGTDMPVEDFLKYNKPPRFLLTSWFAGIFRPSVPPFQAYSTDGALWAMQSHKRWQFLLHILSRPKSAAQFSAFVTYTLYGELFEEINGSWRQRLASNSKRNPHMGQLLYPLPTQTHCTVGVDGVLPAMFSPMGRWQASAESFRKRFSSPTTKVLINVSPLPDCAPGYAEGARLNAGLFDNEFKLLPIRFFNEGDKHFSAEGSRYVSEDAARQILALMPPPGKSPTQSTGPGSR